MTVLASNDSSFGVAASHMDVEPAQNQVLVLQIMLPFQHQGTGASYGRPCMVCG